MPVKSRRDHCHGKTGIFDPDDRGLLLCLLYRRRQIHILLDHKRGRTLLQGRCRKIVSVAVCSDNAEKQAAGDNLPGIIGDLNDLLVQNRLYPAVRTDPFSARRLKAAGKFLYEFSDLH